MTEQDNEVLNITPEARKDAIISALQTTERSGIDKVIEYLEAEGFFQVAASTKFHGNYEGGLAEHSWNVYYYFATLLEEIGIVDDVPMDSLAISAILHDICKIGAYLPNGNGGFKWNRQQPPGHGDLSISRLSTLIELTDLEIDLIKYHMGPWGTIQMVGKGDYTVVDLKDAWNRNAATRFLYFADEVSTQIEPVK